MPGALFVKGTDMPEEQQNLFSGDELAAQATDPAARIEALRREIEHNSYLYYALDRPRSPMARSTRSCTSCAPSRRSSGTHRPVEPDPARGRLRRRAVRAIQHERRMYSLDDAMDAGELDEWLGRVEDFFGEIPRLCAS